MTGGKWKYNQDRTAKDPRGLGISGTEAWGEVYAIVSGDGELFVGFVLDEDDARLAAASPAMLDALKQVREWAAQMGGWDAPCWDAVHSAIADATGDEPPAARPRLSDKLVTLIIRAVKTFGTYDPDRIMVLFEEDLDDREYTTASMFLRWVHVNGRTFGHGNVQEVFAECHDAIGV